MTGWTCQQLQYPIVSSHIQNTHGCNTCTEKPRHHDTSNIVALEIYICVFECMHICVCNGLNWVGALLTHKPTLLCHLKELLQLQRQSYPTGQENSRLANRLTCVLSSPSLMSVNNSSIEWMFWLASLSLRQQKQSCTGHCTYRKIFLLPSVCKMFLISTSVFKAEGCLPLLYFIYSFSNDIKHIL